MNYICNFIAIRKKYRIYLTDSSVFSQDNTRASGLKTAMIWFSKLLIRKAWCIETSWKSISMTFSSSVFVCLTYPTSLNTCNKNLTKDHFNNVKIYFEKHTMKRLCKWIGVEVGWNGGCNSTRGSLGAIMEADFTLLEPSSSGAVKKAMKLKNLGKWQIILATKKHTIRNDVTIDEAVIRFYFF